MPLGEPTIVIAVSPAPAASEYWKQSSPHEPPPWSTAQMRFGLFGSTAIRGTPEKLLIISPVLVSAETKPSLDCHTAPKFSVMKETASALPGTAKPSVT